MLIRKEAISIIVSKIGNEPIVAANGYISRDLCEVCDKPSNFYMIGSMGLASSIGLGIALKKSNRKVYIFDGDANILMNLGSLTTVGSLKPQNFVHIVFDNNSHESTGGQPTSSNSIKIDRIAKSANYKVFKTKSEKELRRLIEIAKKISGPLMILVKVKSSNYVSKRVKITPTGIKNRFMKSL